MLQEPILLAVAAYAAEQHAYQRRAGYDRLPYINHLLKVTSGLIECGETNLELLSAALLHDILEDTPVTLLELQEHFGEEVASIVSELTDDMNLTYETRKRLQYEGISGLSVSAQKIRIADKASNVFDICHYPLDWPVIRKQAYLDSAVHILSPIRGRYPKLDAWFDHEIQEGSLLIAENPQ